MTELSAEVQQFLDEPRLAVFVTLMKNGSPQATPVWVDHDGANVLINIVKGHQKQRNLGRSAAVALCVVDYSQAGRYLQVRGRVVEATGGEEALEHINKLSQKYSGRAYQGRDGEERIKVVIAPAHITYQAGRGAGGGQGSRWTG
jgi:PPOX class probable F420-dependent enzyme